MDYEQNEQGQQRSRRYSIDVMPSTIAPLVGSARFDVYVMDMSYYSGKLESYLRYKKIDYNRIEVTMDIMSLYIYPRTGFAEVPVVYDRQTGLIMRDSTSIIEWFENNYFDDNDNDGDDDDHNNSMIQLTKSKKTRIMFPLSTYAPFSAADINNNNSGNEMDMIKVNSDAMKFIFHVLEDYADEMLWTPAMYFRWNAPVDAYNSSKIFTQLDFLRKGMLNDFIPRSFTDNWFVKNILESVTRFRQYREYVSAFGVGNTATKLHMENIYRRTLNVLETHFLTMPFMFGTHPSFVDFGFMGPMFRHFSIDPTPAKIMRLRAPLVYEWVARTWASSHLQNPSAEDAKTMFTSFPPTLGRLLKDVSNLYFSYLQQNTKAVMSELESFDYKPDDGSRVVYTDSKTSKWRLHSRTRLVKLWESLSPNAQARVTEIFEEHCCDINKLLFASKEEREFSLNEYDLDHSVNLLPLCSNNYRRDKLTNADVFRIYMFGTPRHDDRLARGLIEHEWFRKKYVQASTALLIIALSALLYGIIKKDNMPIAQ